MFCQKCGAENADGATFCQKCGDALNGKAKKVYSRKEIVMSEIIAFVIVLGILGGVFFYNEVMNGNSAQVAIHAYSTHITEDVNVQILIDDEVVYSCSGLEPGEMAHSEKYHVIKFSKFDGSKKITIKAISTGGATGTITDTEDLIILPGEKYTVDLYI